MSLASALEQAATALPDRADSIRPANGDPERLLEGLEPDAAREVLGWLLEHDAAAGEELALAWAELDAGAELVAALDPDALPKPGRKGLRRALHRIRSRGVSLPERPTQPSVARLPQREDDLGGAFLSLPDPSGAQLAVRVDRNPSGGARIFHGAFDWARGLLDFRVYEVNRSQARKLLRDLAAAGAEGFAPVSPRMWFEVLKELGESQPNDRPLPTAFREWRSRLAADGEDTEGGGLPGERVRAAVSVAGPAAAARRVAEWVAEGRIGPWAPPAAELEGFGRRVRETLESKIVVDEGQRRRQLDALIGEFADEWFAGSRGEAVARRLETMAYVFWKREKLEDSEACIAGSEVFRDSAPRDNPIARALLGKSLDPILRAWRREDQDSLLVRP